jgi:hypothetical protein
LDQVINFNDLSLPAVLLLVAIYFIRWGLPNYLKAKKALVLLENQARESAEEKRAKAETARLTMFKDIFEQFANRLITAQEKQSDAICTLAKNQTAQHQSMTGQFQGLEMAIGSVDTRAAQAGHKILEIEKTINKVEAKVNEQHATLGRIEIALAKGRT